MSDLATANRKSASGTTRVPLLRILAALSLVVVISGVGVFAVMYRQDDVVEQAELQELDELDLAEFARAAESRRLDARSVTATLTDVVTADHQESSSDDHPSKVRPVGMTDVSHSEANPTVWLLGTIEDSSEGFASDLSFPRRRESSVRGEVEVENLTHSQQKSSPKLSASDAEKSVPRQFKRVVQE